MGDTISQRELRNDNAEIMRRVEAGERFTVTRNGKPVADVVPHQVTGESVRPRKTLREVQAAFADLPAMDSVAWRAERADADRIFGDDALGDPENVGRPHGW